VYLTALHSPGRPARGSVLARVRRHVPVLGTCATAEEQRDAIEYSAYEEMVRGSWVVSWRRSRALRRPVPAAPAGLIAVGEASIAIVTAAPHRAQAFEACRYVIEEVKQRVPVWKKELHAMEPRCGWTSGVDYEPACLTCSATLRSPAREPADLVPTLQMRCRYCMPRTTTSGCAPVDPHVRGDRGLVRVFPGSACTRSLTGGSRCCGNDLPSW